MKDFFKKYIVLIVLLFLVLILILVKILFGGNNQKNEEPMAPTATPTIDDRYYSNEMGDSGDDSEAINKIPFVGKKMMITSYFKPGVLEVYIRKEEDKSGAEEELRNWAKDWGENFDQLKFVYKISEF